MTVEGGVATAVIPGAAQGVAAYADDWVGFRGIEVAPEHRRRGLARAIMAALLEWGAERGATTAYLQALGHNEAALALYEGLGFTTHHAYAYLTPRADPVVVLRYWSPGKPLTAHRLGNKNVKVACSIARRR